MAEETGNYKLQLSKKVGNDMLNIRADNHEEFDALVSYARESENPELKRFFSTTPQSDTAQAATKVQKAFPGSTADAETPNCPSCGGPTKAKSVNTKFGERTVFECLQQNGECLNDKGFKTSVWPEKKSKGRDS